jgi:hypothetical protein
MRSQSPSSSDASANTDHGQMRPSYEAGEGVA